MQSKDVGGLSEIGFIYEAKKRGLHILKPMTDNRKYDFIVEGSGLYKIQVKSTVSKEKDRDNFRVSTAHGVNKNISYTNKDIDFFAICLINPNIWYIIPVKEITRKSLRLRPHRDDCEFDRFKEAWYQLQ